MVLCEDHNLFVSNNLDSSRGPPKSLTNGPSRINSLRDPNRGPPLRDGPMRSNSLRESSRSNSIRGGPPRMNSIRRAAGRPMPQRSNTQGRTQLLQQMQKMTISDDDQGYNDYSQDDQYTNNNITSPPPNNDQVYDFMIGIIVRMVILTNLTYLY